MSGEETLTNRVVVARRVLASGARERVEVVLWAPTPDGEVFRCEYEIVGLKDRKVRSYAMGADSMQALWLALKMIGTDLYTSKDAKWGLLAWDGQRDLGFPVPDVIERLVPKDDAK